MRRRYTIALLVTLIPTTIGALLSAIGIAGMDRLVQRNVLAMSGRAVEAYLIETPHAAGYLIPYVPDAKLAYVTDLWNPGAPIPAMPNPLMVSVVRGVERAGIQPERFAGGHGSVGPYADLAQAVQRAGGG